MKALKFIALLAVLASPAGAIDLKTLETDCTFNQYYAKTSASTSTHTVVGLGLSYAIKPVGANVSYHVAHTTRTYIARSGVDVSSVTTPEITVVSGDILSSDFRAVTTNPTIVITGFTTSATTYVYIDYCEPKRQ